ncbi:MAG: hypothetical protein U0893_11700 [Chloroflexota bacterium]
MTRSADLTLPAGAFLRFNHSWRFDTTFSGSTPFYWDGGILEYSTNGGTSWTNASPLIASGEGGYTGTLVSGSGNPLGGQAAWVGLRDYAPTRVNLSSLAGQSFRFRFRIGTDSVGGAEGWFIDDVRLYTCAVSATPGITVTPTSGLQTTEGGGQATFTVTLDSQPTANVTVSLSSSNTNEGTVSPSSLTFTPANWSTPQTVTVTGVNDDVDDGNVAYTILTAPATSTDANYNNRDAADVSVLNLNDDIAGILVSPTSGLQTSEGGQTAQFTVVLKSRPTADVTIAISSSNTNEGTVSTPSLTFTPANALTPQTVTVTGVNDSIDDGDVAYTILTGAAVSTDPKYNGFAVDDVAVVNRDDVDTFGITVTPTSGLQTTESGGQATFTVVLTSVPTANVTIALSSSNTAEGTVSVNSLTFTPANALTPQTVTVTGVDDSIDDGDVAYSIVTAAAASTDPLYNGLTVPDVAVTNVNDDLAGFAISPTTGLQTTEAGGTAQFTVRLTSQPTADVSIGLSSSNTAEGTVSPTSLTFTPANWSTPQTVTVTGVNDAIVDGPVAYTIVISPPNSGDPKYQALDPPDVCVTNQDNDVPPPAGITVSPTSGLTTTEAGGTATFTVVLTSVPIANVTIALSSSNTNEGTVSPSSLTFTPANALTPQTVTVTGVNDSVADGDVAYSVVIAPAVSTDPNYNGFNPSDVSVTNVDNDPVIPAGVTVNPTSGLVTSEGGGQATFTVVLNTVPTANVTIALSSSNANEGTVSPSSLTFTPANALTPQTVTVTGVNDSVVDGNVAYAIVTAAAVSTDPNYNGLNPPDVSVTNTDDDTAGSLPTVVKTIPLTGALQDVAVNAERGELYVSRSSLSLVDVISTTDGSVLASIAVSNPVNLAYNRVTGLLYVVENANRKLAVVNTATRQVDAEINFTRNTQGVAVDEVLNRVVVGTFDGEQAVILDATNNYAELARIAVGGTTGVIAVNPVTHRAYVAADGGSGHWQIVVLDLTTNTLRATVSMSGSPSGVAVDPTTNRVYVSSYHTNNVLILDGATDTFRAETIPNGPIGSGLAVNPVSHRLYGTHREAQAVLSVSDLTVGAPTENAVVATLPVGSNAYFVTADPSSGRVYVAAASSVTVIQDITSNQAGVKITPTSGLVTTEGGGNAAFMVELTGVPNASVTIALSSSNTHEGTVSPSSLTFTPTNALRPQLVTVTGVDDNIADGNVAYTVVTAAAVSTDPAYSGLNPPDVSVTNTDDDPATPAGITVSPTSGLVTTEAGGQATFTVKLNTMPTADVTIALSSSSSAEGTISPTSLTFTPTNGTTPQTVTVTGVDDGVHDGDVAYTIVTAPAVSGDPSYSGLNAADVSVTNTDNDPSTPAGFTVSPTSGLVTTEAGGTATFTVVLNTVPTANVTIALSSTLATEGTVSPNSLTFTPANALTPQTVTVTGVNDNVQDGHKAYTVMVGPSTSPDPAYNGLLPTNVSVTNRENPDLSATVCAPQWVKDSQIDCYVQISNPATAGQAAGPIVVKVTHTGTMDRTYNSIGVGGSCNGGGDTVTCDTPDPVNPGGSFQVYVRYQVVGAIGENVSIKACVSGPNYTDDVAGNDCSTVSGTIRAPAGITVNPTSGLTTTEAGGTAQFTVKLNSQPTANVIIGLSSSDTTEGTVSPSSLTFTPANWSTPQTVTVTGVDDAVVDGPIAYTIVTAPAVSTDPSYNGLNPSDVSVTNLDDTDTAGITVSPTAGLQTSENGQTAQFTVKLNSQPTANVTIGLSSSNTNEGTVSPSSLTFTPANWSTPQTATVTGVNDSVVDGSVAYTIVTAQAVSTDPVYSGLNPPDVSVTNTDNDSGYRLQVKQQSGGTVNDFQSGNINCGARCSAAYPPNTPINLYATAAEGWHFVKWTGDCANLPNPCPITMNADKDVSAEFAPNAAVTTFRPDILVRRLTVKITLPPECGTITRIEFGQLGSPMRNAKVSISSPSGGPQNQTVGFVYLPPVTSIVEFTLERVVQAGDATVNPIVINSSNCTKWRTFVGAGPTAFQ